jgi:hypothetical protein
VHVSTPDRILFIIGVYFGGPVAVLVARVDVRDNGTPGGKRDASRLSLVLADCQVSILFKPIDKPRLRVRREAVAIR